MRLFGLDIRPTTASNASEPPSPPKPRALPDLWTNLDLDAKVQPSWAKIYASPLWQNDLLPWFQALRVQTYKMLRDEVEPEVSRALQVRILLLEGLINQPLMEHERLKQLMQNRYGAGDDPDELRDVR